MPSWIAPIERVNLAIGRTVRWIVLAMVLIQFGTVVMRYVFGTSAIWVQESVLYLHAALFTLGAGYTLVVDGHVRVDIFYGEASDRRRAWVDLVGSAVFLVPGCLAILVLSWRSMVRSWAILEGPISVGGIPASFLLKTLVPLFAVLLLVQGVAMALRALLVLRGAAAPPPAASGLPGVARATTAEPSPDASDRANRDQAGMDRMGADRTGAGR